MLLDSYQAIGTMPIDVKALGVDLLVAGALKYLLASAGLGFLYCRRDLFEQLRPTATGWFADADVFAMDIQDYSPAARRPPLPGRHAADPEHLRRHRGHRADEGDRHRRDARARRSAQRDARSPASTSSAAASSRRATPPRAERSSPSARPTSTRSSARSPTNGILTSSRDGNLRVSAHCYNTHEDIETLLAGLERHRALLA